jgi:uncharacterized protein
MVRFHQLVIEPYLADLEAGQASQVWAGAAHTVESKIYGPHFEAVATEWTARYAAAEKGLAVGPVGQTHIACREHKTSHEIDVLALVRGTRPRSPEELQTEAAGRQEGLLLASLETLYGQPA